MAQLPLGHFHFISTHLVEIIVVVVTTILFLFWSRARTNPIRRDKHFDCDVEIISDEASCNQVINEWLAESRHTPIGFDCEWTPSIPQFDKKKYKIGLLQLAKETKILLIRFNKMNYIVPDALKSLLENDQILKCGVGIQQDITKIYRDFGIKTRGVIELNDIYKISSYFDKQNPTTKSLKHLYEITCDESMIFKHKDVTLSHWNSYNALSKPQIHYAADDALVAHQIFIELMEDIFGIIDCNEYITECAAYIDVRDIKEKKEKSENDLQSVHKQRITKQRKADRVKAKRSSVTPSVRYKVLKPDGSILFYCGKFQCEWFVANHLAETVNDTSCKLVFEHADKSKLNERSRDNICFACGIQGTEDNEVDINRFSILKHCYWKQLKNEEIQQRSLIGNMIPLCFKTSNDCMTKAKQSRVGYMQYLCNTLNVRKHPDLLRQDAKYKAAKKAANALNQSHDNIPIKRQIELVKDVAEYFGLAYDEDLKGNEQKQLHELLEITDKYRAKILKSDKEQTELHVNDLLDHYKNNEKAFVEVWREQFVNCMKPQFVPSYWPLIKIPQ